MRSALLASMAASAVASEPMTTSVRREVLTGSDYCHLDGEGGHCVTNGQRDSDEQQSCNVCVCAVQDLCATSTHFHMERRWDDFDISGNGTCTKDGGVTGPWWHVMNAGQTLAWLWACVGVLTVLCSIMRADAIASPRRTYAASERATVVRSIRCTTTSRPSFYAKLTLLMLPVSVVSQWYTNVLDFAGRINGVCGTTPRQVIRWHITMSQPYCDTSGLWARVVGALVLVLGSMVRAGATETRLSLSP